MKKITFLLMTFIMAFAINGWGQTTIDFETEGAGYTPSATHGSGDTDVFNRTNPDIGGNSTYMWSAESINLTNPTIVLNQINITGATSFTFSIDMIAHHYNDWDNSDELKITYSIDGGAYQNLMWVESITDPASSYNEPAALDPNFDGTGDCAYVLPALTTGTGTGGCVVSVNIFETFLASDIAISGTTLDITLQFMGLTSGDEGIYLDNIVITQAGAGGVNNPTSFTATTSSTDQINLTWIQNTNTDNVMVAWSADGTFGTPSGSYIPGNTITGGGTVIYNGDALSFDHSSLNSNTQYYYKAWSVDGTTTYSSGVTDDATTYKNEPTNHVTSFTATNGSPASSVIDLTWVDAAADVIPDAYLVKGSSVSYADISAPADGIPEIDGGLVLNVTQGTQSATFSGLNASTTYYFKIWPYTNSLTAIDFKTDGTVPQNSETTDVAPIIPNVFISEYIEGGSSNKAIEIVNASTGSIELSDFVVKLAGNGGDWGNTITLSGSLGVGEVYVIGNASASDIVKAKTNITSSVTYFNGDDAVGLFYQGVFIDGIGIQGVDPGTAWDVAGTTNATLNHTLVRKLAITTGNTDWASSAGTDASNSEWIVFDQDHFFNLGVFGTGWGGATDNGWAEAANWDVQVPDATVNTLINASASNFPTLSATGNCKDITLESYSGGDASLMGQSYLTVAGTTIVQRYTTAAMWHGISSPLSGADFNSLYFNGSPDVWGMSYNEPTNDYTYASSLSTPLEDMKGWLVWIDGSTAQTFDFTGSLRSGTQGTVDNVVNSVPDASHGFNFVGNPFPSAIDWNDAGWTKTNVDGGFWIWNAAGDVWSTYNVVGGTNLGTQYIPVGQGFFVQVNASESTGTLQMEETVQVHNSVAFMKNQKTETANFIKLKLTDGNLYDESIIHLNNAATVDFDSQLDMHKLFSFNDEQPQLYSTANNFMTINSLPIGSVSVPMDVVGADGNEMTISIEEVNDFANVYITDEFLNIQANLSEESYSFTYDADVTNRFTIYFTAASTPEINSDNIKVYSYDNNIRVIIPVENNVHLEIINMLGQKVKEEDVNIGTHDIHVYHSGFYIVNIISDNHQTTKKVFIK